MKTEVHTLRFGDAPWLAECAPTLDAWCERHGYKLRVWSDPSAWEAYPSPKFVQIDMLREFLKGKASYFLYVDADVLVRDDAPEFPFLRGMRLATDSTHRAHNDLWYAWCAEHYGPATPDHDYCNAGVWSIDRESAKKLLVEMERHAMIDAGGFQEQHWLNAVAWAARFNGMSILRLSSDWNRWGRDFEASWFIHFWGTEKEGDIETYRKTGLLDVKPDGLRRNVLPEGPFDCWGKVVVQEFVQDAGLGNQLFEWAAGYSIAKRLNLPFRWIWRPSNKRDFGLAAFGLGESPYVEYPLLMMRAGQGNRTLVERAVTRITESKERFCGISCPFQAEECFDDAADDIRQIFKLEPMELPNPEGTTPVAVQVRRGDYIGHSRLQVTTLDYFNNAMAWMRANVSSPHLIVVSDDPEWCQSQFGKLDDVTVMPPQEPIDGLRTLASCDAHIISNSTFGWWGAWLGEKGPVIVPEIWHHKPGAYGDWNPVPDRWLKMGISKGFGIQAPVAKIALELPPPGIERAIVYPWHADAERWEELRISLRSIEKHFEDKHCPIYILGTRRPAWLAEHPRVNYLGAWTYREALTRGVQMAEKVLWMNDDIVLLKPVTWRDCEVTRYLRDVSPDFLTRTHVNLNPWRIGVLKVSRQLAKEGITDQKVFSTHMPYVFERTKALDVFRRFGTWEKFPMEIPYFHLYGENPVQIGDERAHGLPFGDAMFLNYADRHLTHELKEALIERFPQPAEWEQMLMK